MHHGDQAWQAHNCISLDCVDSPTLKAAAAAVPALMTTKTDGPTMTSDEADAEVAATAQAAAARKIQVRASRGCWGNRRCAIRH